MQLEVLRERIEKDKKIDVVIEEKYEGAIVITTYPDQLSGKHTNSSTWQSHNVFLSDAIGDFRDVSIRTHTVSIDKGRAQKLIEDHTKFLDYFDLRYAVKIDRTPYTVESVIQDFVAFKSIIYVNEEVLK